MSKEKYNIYESKRKKIHNINENCYEEYNNIFSIKKDNIKNIKIKKGPKDKIDKEKSLFKKSLSQLIEKHNQKILKVKAISTGGDK